jgi:hypothetical protein
LFLSLWDKIDWTVKCRPGLGWCSTRGDRIDLGRIDWDRIDWDRIDWDRIDWDMIDWDKIDWAM